MTPEILNHLTALKDVIAEKMGEWQFNDRFVYGEDEWTVVKVHDEFITAINIDYWKRNFDDDDEALIPIPLAIDTENPRRGLWGMVDWDKYWPSISHMGELSIQTVDFPRKVICAYATPYLALLKALASQEGVEVAIE